MISSSVCYLIPIFNNQRGLDASLASIAREVVPADIFVVDDGSTPPVQIDPGLRLPGRLSLCRLERNAGIVVALNTGLQKILRAGYEFVSRLDAGDTVLPFRTNLQMQYLRERTRVGLISSSVDFVDDAGARIYTHRPPCSHVEIVEALRLNNCLLHPAVMMRTSVVAAAGGYREQFQVAEDYELFMRMTRLTEVASIPHVLTRCHANTRGITMTRRREQLHRRLQIQLEHFSGAALNSYVGIARTLAAYAVPDKCFAYAKAHRSRNAT